MVADTKKPKPEMSPRERVLCALRLEEPDRVPYCEFEVNDLFAGQLMGWASSGKATSFNARTAKEEIEVSERLGRDNIVINFRPPVFAETAPGVRGREFYGEGWIKTERDLDRMQFPDPCADETYAEVAEFARGKGDYCAVAAIRLGLGSAMLSMGIEHFCMTIYDNPDLIREVMRRYADWTSVVVEKLAKLGFDVIYAADDMATKHGPFFSPTTYRELILPFHKQVAEHISIPWIHHSDGNLMPVIEDWLSLGMNGMNPIEPGVMDIKFMKERYGHRVCLVGNVSVDLLSRGTPEQVVAETKQLLRDIAPGGGYILASGNSITDYCRVENVLAMTKTLKEYGTYPISVPD